MNYTKLQKELYINLQLARKNYNNEDKYIIEATNILKKYE